MGVDIPLGDDVLPSLSDLADTNIRILKIEKIYICENSYFIFTINGKGKYRSTTDIIAYEAVMKMKDAIESSGKAVYTYFTLGSGGKFIFQRPKEVK
jgi:hypothetical protein